MALGGEELRCGWSSVVVVDGDAVVISPFSCRSWQCESCAERRRWRLRDECASGRPNKFLTLTCNPALYTSADEAAQDLVCAWRAVLKRLKRQGIAERVEYMAVFEATKKGWPHLHIVCRAPWIDQRWLSDAMRELTGAPVCDVRAVHSQRQLGVYLAKYLSKNPERYQGCKRYWASRGFRLDAERSQRVRSPSGRFGFAVRSRPEAVAHRFAVCGWELVSSEGRSCRVRPGGAAYLPYWYLGPGWPGLPDPPVNWERYAGVGSAES